MLPVSICILTVFSFWSYYCPLQYRNISRKLLSNIVTHWHILSKSTYLRSRHRWPRCVVATLLSFTLPLEKGWVMHTYFARRLLSFSLPFSWEHSAVHPWVLVCQFAQLGCAVAVWHGYSAETRIIETGTAAGQSLLQSWLMGHNSAAGRLLAHVSPCTSFCYSSGSTAIVICY